MSTTRPNQPGPPSSYEIRLRGHLDHHWAEWFGVPELTHEEGGTTLLRAADLDQSALHGLLQRIRDLGVPLISLTLVAANPTA